MTSFISKQYDVLYELHTYLAELGPPEQDNKPVRSPSTLWPLVHVKMQELEVSDALPVWSSAATLLRSVLTDACQRFQDGPFENDARLCTLGMARELLPIGQDRESSSQLAMVRACAGAVSYYCRWTERHNMQLMSEASSVSV